MADAVSCRAVDIHRGVTRIMASSDRLPDLKPAAQAGHAQGEASAMNGLSRLSERFGAGRGAGAGASAVSPSAFSHAAAALGPASHPVADLNRLAALWKGEQPPGADAGGEGMTLPGPAAVALHASRLGLEAICEQRGIAGLRAADMPCVVLLAAGGSRLVVGLQEAKDGEDACFMLATSAGNRLVPVPELALAANGTIFRLRRTAQADMAGTEHSTAAQDDGGARGAGSQHPPQAQAGVSAGTISGFLIFAMRERKKLIIQLIAASAMINLLGMALPLFCMAVFDRVIPHAAFETLWALALGVCLALYLELALRHARLKLFDAAGQSASLSLQGRLIGRLLHARLVDVPRSAGGLMYPAQELDNMANIAPQLIVSVLVDVPYFVILLVFLASIAGPVALAPLIGTGLMVAIHVLCHKMAHEAHAGHSGFMRRQIQAMMDSIGAQERIRVTGSAGQFLSSWERAADEAGFAAHESRYWHGLAAQASAVIVQLVIIAAIVIGVFRIDAAAMTIGALSAAILLVNRAMTPVSILTGLVFRVMQGLQSAAPLSSVLTAEVESGTDLRGQAAVIQGQVSFARVSFSYPGEARPALKDVTLSFRPGEHVGIIGKAGCGKSTLLKLIARLHEPGEGRLSLDGRDIRQYDPALIRRAIAYMPQEAQLVDASLEENLTLGLAQVPRSETERVARISGVHDFASQHPSGYSLMVGQGGCRISGGERQCVALARALMGAPAMLMLDEPTSAMDNALEARVIKDLKAELSGKGLIVATHRLQMLALVDRVIWLEGGRVVADGPKEDVFKRFGLVA